MTDPTLMQRASSSGADSTNSVGGQSKTCEALSEALSRLKVEQNGASVADTASSSAAAMSSDPVDVEEATGEKAGANGSANGTTTIDLALVDAMRNTRDRNFILRQEKDMEDKIQDERVTHWELPLMNSYQRLLVHRIADHFRLAHSIDIHTKQVTLTKQEQTRVPDQCISTLAGNERLSEPASAAFPPLLNSLSGQATTSGAGAMSGAPLGVRIMRREGGSSASRASSSRNGSATPEDSVLNGARKDRRNMTREEREASYYEARQRIFGSESVSTDESASQPAPGSRDEVQKDTDAAASSSRSIRSASSGSQADAYVRDASGAADYDLSRSSTRNANRSEGSLNSYNDSIPSQQPLSYAESAQIYPPYGVYPCPINMDQQNHPHPQQYHQHPPPNAPPYFYVQPGQWSNGTVPFQSLQQPDGYGRPWTYGMASVPYSPHGSAYPNYPMTAYAEHTQSPGASSRSTSISAGTEGGYNSRHSSVSDQNGASQPQQAAQQGQATAKPPASAQNGRTPPVPRSQSISPSVAFPRQTPPRSGNVTPAGMCANGISPNGVNQNVAWQQNYFAHPPQQYPSPLPYSPALAGDSRNGVPRFVPAGTPTSPTGIVAPAYGSGALWTEDGSLRMGMSVSSSSRGRGRSSQGGERSLYDPNKPTTDNSLKGSAAAASIHSNGSTKSSASATNGKSTRPPLSTGGQSMRSTSSSSVSARSSQGFGPDATTHPSTSPSSASSSSFARPVHPSLPARPDWAVSPARVPPSQSSTPVEAVKAHDAIDLSQARQAEAVQETSETISSPPLDRDG